MVQDDKEQQIHWISDRPVAARFEIARSRVWAWVRQGKLPKPRKIAKKISRWNSAEVDHFMEKILDEHNEGKD